MASSILKRHRRGWLSLLLALSCLAGCARHYRLGDPSDMSQLPVRRGWSGQNVVAVTPWRYLGSRYETHEFRYYFDWDNAQYFRNVSVARDRTVLHFEERPLGHGKHWVTLETAGGMFHFSLLPMHR